MLPELLAASLITGFAFSPKSPNPSHPESRVPIVMIRTIVHNVRAICVEPDANNRDVTGVDPFNGERPW